MKYAYPVVITPDEEGTYLVEVPDLEIYTEGKDIPEAIEMARDAIGIMGVDMEDDKKDLPKPTAFNSIKLKSNEFVTLVDVDFYEYRRKNETKVVKKNCTLPSWLCYEAEKANINFSQLLQNAIKEELKIAT